MVCWQWCLCCCRHCIEMFALADNIDGLCGTGDVFDLEITSILNAASKVMTNDARHLLCTMAMMTISTVVVLMTAGGAVQ